MSATINGTSISLTRGDTLQIQISITDASGERYSPAEGDVIRFAMKQRYSDPTPILVKTIPNETLILLINPEDTKSLSYGAYKYDIELTTATGIVDTFIPRADFKILEEVV